MHDEPVAAILLGLTAILAAARLGGELSERLGQPSVLGELLAGVLLGNLVLIDPSWSWFEPLRSHDIVVPWAVAVDAVARIGVLLLLFEVGLETTVGEMRRVGTSSLLVAIVGVVSPFILGYFTSAWFIREVPPAILAVAPGFALSNIHLFIGAILCATSVGITARVLRDLGRLSTPESRIILGAAVIDDVLGLIILSVVGGIVVAAETGQAAGFGRVAWIVVTALGFVAGSLALGRFVVPRFLNAASRFRTGGMMFLSAIVLCFGFSSLAWWAGLAPIVGAFAAGLVLESVHFTRFDEKLTLPQMLSPMTAIFVPVFFVQMGIQVRLEAFGSMGILGIAGALTLAAIVGKLLCGVGVREKGLDRVLVGIGMLPRGEVGLIMAAIGRELGVVDDALFSAVVIMVMLTTVATPPLLKMRLTAGARRRR